MTFLKPRSGYTLPVFACAAAVAALRWLRHPQPLDAVSIDLIEPVETVEIPIEQVAGIGEGMALAITRSDPGDNLDLTRNTPIWALVEWVKEAQIPEFEPEAIAIKGGEGIGRMVDAGDKAAIYAYAQQVLRENLGRLLEPGEKIQVTIILPEGRALAQRTSNAAFGVVEGLSLLGTRGISQPLSAGATLEAYQEELQQKASKFDCLVFCVGENGLDLAAKLGINPSQLVKTANWLGPLLVAAGLYNVKSILLFGYHGKLIKLAGGIFHTHHHLADGRLEIITAYCAQVGLPTAVLQTIFALPTAEGGLKYLRELDAKDGTDWVERVYGAIASRIDQRSCEYIRNLGDRDVLVGSIMFDRDRQIVVKSKIAAALMYQLC